MVQMQVINIQDNLKQQERKIKMLNQFRNYLINKGYKEFSANGTPSTAIDYVWRIEKVIEKENMTEQQLIENITIILKQYDKAGEKWCIGRRSHESYINALKQFRKFLLIQRFGGANA